MHTIKKNTADTPKEERSVKPNKSESLNFPLDKLVPTFPKNPNSEKMATML